jgi:hypothetical protein
MEPKLNGTVLGLAAYSAAEDANRKASQAVSEATEAQEAAAKGVEALNFIGTPATWGSAESRNRGIGKQQGVLVADSGFAVMQIFIEDDLSGDPTAPLKPAASTPCDVQITRGKTFSPSMGEAQTFSGPVVISRYVEGSYTGSLTTVAVSVTLDAEDPLVPDQVIIVPISDSLQSTTKESKPRWELTWDEEQRQFYIKWVSA